MVYFRQHDDRHVSDKIKLMKWNTLMDLIAIGMKNGDVSVHRLVNWQKIWVLSWPPPGPCHGAHTSTTTTTATAHANTATTSDTATASAPESSAPTGGDGKSKESHVASPLDITAMEWRPDGKVLAVGYNRNVKYISIKDRLDGEEGDDEEIEEARDDSSIVLVDIENGQVITTIDIPDALVMSMCWQSKNNFILNEQYKVTAFTEFLEKLTPLTKSYSTNYSRKLTEEGIEDIMKVSSQPNLNLMAIGTSLGQVYVYVFGIFLVGVYSLQDTLPITHVSFTNDLNALSVVIGTDKVDHSSKLDNYQYRSFQLPFFKRNGEQYFIVSHIYAKIISLLSYLEDIIASIQETMEDILLELDSKLTSYLQPKGPNKSGSGSSVLLADELLELLVIGTLSDSLEKFLHQLTDKGLKKLGYSIECTYLSIQKLVVCNVQRACKHIFSHLNVLKAISLWTNEFSSLGFKTDDINRAIHGVATFYLKALELQQVIDSSCQNLKCFFRWLYSVTLRFYNDSVSSSQQESIKISQQDLQYVADFIEENFDCQDNHQDDSMSETSSSSGNRPTATNFTLERVCQYLKPDPLVYRTFAINDQSLNPWFKYLKERPMLVNNAGNADLILFKHNPETSLITDHVTLEGKAYDAFKAPSAKMSEVFCYNYDSFLTFTYSFPAREAPKVSTITDDSTGFSYVAISGHLEGENDVALMKFPAKDPGRVMFALFTVIVVEPGIERETTPMDIQFYSDSILSMLLTTQDSHYSYLMQLPLSSIENYFLPILSGCSLQQLRRDMTVHRILIDAAGSEISIRRLDNFKPSQFAVSGSRKVTCISSKAKRRVRVFEMDGNEEEAEESEIFE